MSDPLARHSNRFLQSGTLKPMPPQSCDLVQHIIRDQRHDSVMFLSFAAKRAQAMARREPSRQSLKASSRNPQHTSNQAQNRSYRFLGAGAFKHLGSWLVESFRVSAGFVKASWVRRGTVLQQVNSRRCWAAQCRGLPDEASKA